jgi:carbon-monoxide dehydrogenase large subunit
MVHDCGQIINPAIVDGQVMGGIAHGIGNALFECMHFDPAGQPLTTTFAEYLLPASTESPAIRLHHYESPSPLNPLGAKGVGESGVLPTPAAIVGAVEDALSDFNVRFDCVPLAPSQIVASIRAGVSERRG